MRFVQVLRKKDSSRRLLLCSDDRNPESGRLIDVTSRIPGLDSVWLFYKKLLFTGSGEGDLVGSVQSLLGESLDGNSIEGKDVVVAPGEGNPDSCEYSLLPPIDQPENPWAFQLWGAGVTHKRSADAREEEALSHLGRSIDIYDRMYVAGVDGGRPESGEVGAKPEIFFKGNGNQVVGSGGELKVAELSRRLSPEPELVAFFVGDAGGAPTLIGFAGGNDFSDQGWETENPLYLVHAKVQDGLASLGPVFVSADDPTLNVEEVHLRCRVSRSGQVLMDSDDLTTGSVAMSHSLENLAFHLFHNRAIQPDEVRGLYLGTSAVFPESASSGDLITIEYDSGLGTLWNSVVNAGPSRELNYRFLGSR